MAGNLVVDKCMEVSPCSLLLHPVHSCSVDSAAVSFLSFSLSLVSFCRGLQAQRQLRFFIQSQQGGMHDSDVRSIFAKLTDIDEDDGSRAAAAARPAAGTASRKSGRLVG